jgi:hypothetical protein
MTNAFSKKSVMGKPEVAADGQPAAHTPSESDASGWRQQALADIRRCIYVRRSRRALLSRLLSGEWVEAGEFYESVDLPPDLDRSCLRAVPDAFVRAGIIQSLLWFRPRRRKKDANPILGWKLADQRAALNWLAANPDLPDLLLGSEISKSDSDETRPTAATAGRKTKSFHSSERTKANG